jgi:hypothetical protein
LHQIKRFVTIAYRNLRNAQSTLLDLRQKPVQFLFALQRIDSRDWFAGARYRKSAATGARQLRLPAKNASRSISVVPFIPSGR